MKTTADQLAKRFRVSRARSLEAVMKADLIDAVLRVSAKDGLTHARIAAASGLSRSAVTGILSGSIQKVTLDRLLKLVEAVGLTARVHVKRAA